MDERFNPYWFGLILLAFLLAVTSIDCTAPPTLPAPEETATSAATEEPTGTGTPTALPTPSETPEPTSTRLPTPFPTPTRIVNTPAVVVTPFTQRPLYEARVTADTLNIRSGPGTSYPVVGQVHIGDWVSCWDQSTEQWCEIDPPDSGDFVFAAYLEVVRDFRFEKETDEPNSN